MHPYQGAVATIAMLIGLGVARILTCLAAAVRTRRMTRIDSISVIWAAVVFLTELDLWWALQTSVNAVENWTFLVFLMLAVQPLLLFFAAAMILPPSELKSGECYREQFEHHGRWALLAVSAYYVENLVEDIAYWGVSPLGWWAVVTLVMAALPIMAMLSSRRVGGAIGVFYLLINVVFIFVDIDRLT